MDPQHAVALNVTQTVYELYVICMTANGNAVWTVTIGNPADVNRDGTVDSADIVAVIKEMPDGDKKADVNNDGVIDSADIVAVIKAMK